LVGITSLVFLLAFAFSSLKESEWIDKMQSLTSSFEKKDIEQREALSQVYSIQSQQKKLEAELAKLEKQKDKLSIDIKANLQHLDVLKAQMNDLKTLISMRLRVSGQIVDSSMKDIVLLSKSPSEIERLLKGISYLLEKDILLVKELQNKKQIFLKAQTETTEKIKSLTANKQAQKEKADKLEHLKTQKNNYIAKIQRDKKKYLHLLADLRKKGEAELLNTDTATSLIRKTFFENKKQLDMPVVGKVIQDFGVYEKHQIKLFSKGIYFSTTDEQDVNSVAHGKVVFIGDVKDYKNTIVLDHGNHYYSVYSFLTNVKVKVGEQVDKRQILGKSGYNPYMEVNGMYFEIRHFSDPLNPADWFMGSYKSISKNQSNRGKL
jgi:murein hydrolase activator